MSKRKILFIVTGLSFAILLTVAVFVYFGNSTVAKAVGIDKEFVVEEIPFAGGVTVIYREGDFLRADHLEKGVLGWKKVNGNAPLLARVPEGEIYNQNAFSWFSSNVQTLFWGYTPPNAKFSEVSFLMMIIPTQPK